MTKPLSVDLRERVVAAVDGGLSRRKAAERFGVSISSAIRWTSQLRRTGDVRPRRVGGDKRSKRIEAHAPVILSAVEEKPDVTLAELRDLLAQQGVAVAISTLWRFFARRKITLKKRMARPVCKGDFERRLGLHQRIRSQGLSPGQDGCRALRAS
jgi:transposase